jgi:hypothetical protein
MSTVYKPLYRRMNMQDRYFCMKTGDVRDLVGMGRLLRLDPTVSILCPRQGVITDFVRRRAERILNRKEVKSESTSS